jgi:hypothetical protein
MALASSLERARWFVTSLGAAARYGWLRPLFVGGHHQVKGLI